MSGILGESFRGYGRNMTVRIIALAIMLPMLCVCIFVPLGMVNRLELSIWWLIIPAASFLLVLIGGSLGTIAVVLYRRTRGLDQVALPLGMQGENYQLFYRQYHGKFKDRDISIYFSRGPTVEIELPTSLQTRMGISPQGIETLMLAGWMQREPIQIHEPQLSELLIFALDESWAQQLLNNPQVPLLLRQLIFTKDAFPNHQILLIPGYFRLRLFGSMRLLDFSFNLSSQQLRSWLENMVTLVEIAESLPAPRVTDEVSSAEQAARSMRQQDPRQVMLLVMGMVIAMIFCSIALGVAAFLWALSQ